MKIAILGSGGREHALAVSIHNSKKTQKIYCLPGNAGTANIAENININVDDFDLIYDFVKKKDINLVIVGPEKPLVNGIVDFLEKKDVLVFGPKKKSAQLEGSKIFTKKICEKYKIPTAKFGIFESKKLANDFVKKTQMPTVIKADGLASGKGVYICNDLLQCQDAIEEIFNGKFGIAKNVLIEEFLEGEEMSFFIISDGKNFKFFQTAQDHKRVGEGDTGKNTGGMGAYSPSNIINDNLYEKIINQIIKPTLVAIKDLEEDYTGFLYAGLMVKNGNPYLIEYNVRMGDPECQTILPLLKSDFLDLIIACKKEELDSFDIKWKDMKSMCVVLCANGYPDDYKKNIEIKNISNLKMKSDNFLFHAGTTITEKKIFSIGGRVLNFVSIDADLNNARKKILNQINELNWNEGFFRRDIGYKAIDN
mgnify:FL=1